MQSSRSSHLEQFLDELSEGGVGAAMTLAEGLEGGRGWVQPADASLVLADEGLRLAGPRLSRKVVICQLAFTQHALRHRPEQRNVRSKE